MVPKGTEASRALQATDPNEGAAASQASNRSAEEAELELLCSAVDEESFGTAMADCVLIQESP